MNLGAPEIFVLALLGVLLFGPEKLPEFARKVARVVKYLRGIANDARGSIANELGPEFADIKVADLNPRGLVRHIVESADSEARATAAMLPTLTGIEDAVLRPAPTPYDPEAT